MEKRNAVKLISAFLLVTLLFFSCESTSNKEYVNSGTKEAEQMSINLESAGVVTIPVDPHPAYTYFSAIKPEILALVEKGSPEAIREAVSLLHKPSSEEYTESEKVLLNICAEIMKICWPSQTVSWDVPAVSELNPYLGAVSSARNGIYDSSTGNNDFLTIVLPSLVLLTSESRNDYYVQSEAALIEALALRSDSVLANYLMSFLMRRLQQTNESLDYINKCALLCSNCFEIKINQAYAYYYNNNYTQAFEYATSLLTMAPQNVLILQLCAESAYAMKSYETTEYYVNRVLQLEPENTKYVLFRAKLLMNRGDYIKASSLLDVYSRTNQTDKEYLMLRSRLQKDWNKNTTAAVDTVSQALSLYPDDEDVIAYAARLSSETNQPINQKTAFELTEKLLSYDGENVEAQVISLNEMMKMAEWEKAYALSSSLLGRPDCPFQVNSMHISICLALDKRTEANDLATRLYRENPSDETIQEQYLRILVTFNRRAEGLALIERLLPSANSRMKSFLLYEKSYFENTENSSLNDLRSSLTANPRNKDALFRLYEIYYNRRDYRKAQYYLKQVVALNPADKELLRLNSELEQLIK